MSPEALATQAAWIEILEGMEADLEADRLLFDQQIPAAQHAGWDAPQQIGPIPAELLDRATRILSQLEDSSKKLSEIRDATGQQLSAVRSIPSARTAGSVYLDVAG